MAFPFIAASAGAALIILQQLLMLNVGFHRFATGTGVGVGDDRRLERKVRRHGNLAENAALFIVMLSLTEMAGAPASIVLGFALVFLTARLAHAVAFMSLGGSHDPSGPRVFLLMRSVGAFATAFSGIGLGARLAYLLVAQTQLAT